MSCLFSSSSSYSTTESPAGVSHHSQQQNPCVTLINSFLLNPLPCCLLLGPTKNYMLSGHRRELKRKAKRDNTEESTTKLNLLRLHQNKSLTQRSGAALAWWEHKAGGDTSLAGTQPNTNKPKVKVKLKQTRRKLELSTRTKNQSSQERTKNVVH